LKINTLFQEDHQAKLTVELEQELLENAKQRAARQIAKRTRIPGFRPGKAPYHVILRTVGEGSVVQTAIDLLLDDIYPELIKESQIKPYGPGSLNNILSLEPPTLEFVVPLEPTVALLDYSDLRIPYNLEPVSEDDVNQTLEDLRDRDSAFETVDRPASVGDQVTLRLKADRKNADENEETVLIQERQTALTVNAEDADTKTEWPFSGFSRNLEGMSAGDEKTFEYAYPEDAYLEYLRGTEADFYIKVEGVKVRQLPELNDDFAKKFGEYETLDALREEIRQGLTEQRTSDYDREYENKIIDEIIKTAEINYPPQLLDREIQNFKSQLENRLAQQNLDLETYMKTRQIDEAGLKTELTQPAEDRLRRSLILFEVAKLEEIRVDEQAVQNQTISTIDQIQKMYKPEDAKKILTQEFIQSMVSNISSDLLVQSTLSRLKSIAKGEGEISDETSQATQDQSTASESAEKPEEDEPVPTLDSVVEGEAKQPAIEEENKAKPTKKRKPRKEIE
jgi:trigger factor